MIGQPAIVATEHVSVCFGLPDEQHYLSLSDEDLKLVRDTFGQLAFAMAMLLNAAIIEPRLTNLLARVVKTTAEMFEEEARELKEQDETSAWHRD